MPADTTETVSEYSIRLQPSINLHAPVGGVSNVFLTYFDYFFGGQYKLGGLRGTRGGLNTPTNRVLNRHNV